MQTATGVLLRQHVDPNVRQPDGASALHWAAHWDDLDLADLLIGAGADVNAADRDGMTPLVEACTNGSASMRRSSPSSSRKRRHGEKV